MDGGKLAEKPEGALEGENSARGGGCPKGNIGDCCGTGLVGEQETWGMPCIGEN